MEFLHGELLGSSSHKKEDWGPQPAHSTQSWGCLGQQLLNFGRKPLWCPQGDHRVHSPTRDPGAAKVWGDFGKAKPPEGGQVLLRSLHFVGAATLFKNLATNLYHTVLKLDHFACIAVLGERFRYTFELSDFGCFFFFTIQYKKMYISPLFSLYETG